MCSLSAIEAFQAMRLFLESYFERTKSADVGSLLGDLQIAEDGTTFDPAAWVEWLDCLQKAKTLPQPKSHE